MTEKEEESIKKILTHLGIKEESAFYILKEIQEGNRSIEELLILRKMWRLLPLESSDEHWIDGEVSQYGEEGKKIFKRIFDAGVSKKELTSVLKGNLLSFIYTFLYSLEDPALCDWGCPVRC